jgi:hypothetical protein
VAQYLHHGQDAEHVDKNGAEGFVKVMWQDQAQIARVATIAQRVARKVATTRERTARAEISKHLVRLGS